MKFYYNGKLVRTSKTHEYKYALLNRADRTLACSATRKGAETAYNRAYKDKACWLDIYTKVLNGTYRPKKTNGKKEKFGNGIRRTTN